MEAIYSHPDKLLQDHLQRVVNTGIKLFKDKKGLELPHDPTDTQHLLKYLLVFHDAGKMTPYFQAYLLKKKGHELLKHKGLTAHGLVSALITAYQVYCFFADHPQRMFYTSLALAAVRKHHGNLENLKDMLIVNRKNWEIVEQQLQHCPAAFFREHFNGLLKTFDYNLENLKACHRKIHDHKWEMIDGSSIETYFYFNFLYSLLLYADKYEAIFSRETRVSRRQVAVDIVDRYKAQAFAAKATGLNRTRELIYRGAAETLNQLCPADEKRIFSINVPTGSGKTLCSLNAALKLREQSRQRIIYCLPFTSVIDQNADVFAKVLSVDFDRVTSDLLLKHHHLVEPQWQDDEHEYSGEKAEFLIETWSGEWVVTTFWQFFHTLFSGKNAQLKKFHHIANSVIILDEVQAIPVKYWTLLNKALAKLVHLFNCKILLVTATMPMIFSETREEILELVPRKETHFRSLNRVRLHIDSTGKSVHDFARELRKTLKKDKRYLFILNTIQSSLELYNELKEYQPLYLSTNIIPRHRLERIKYLKKKQPGDIVVSTQLVEAGVDIDFDVVYRDNAPLDAINQGAGRCNRENQMNRAGEVILVHLVNHDKSYASYIYDKLLLHTTTELLKNEKIITEDRFFDVSRKYFARISTIISQQPSDEVMQQITRLNYEEAFTGKNAFRLIENVFERENVFVEVDKEAREIRKEYEKIKQIKDRWERKNEFNKIKTLFSQHIISIARQTLEKNRPPSLEQGEGGFYFIPYDQLNEYYDMETGFKAQGVTAIW